MTNLSLKEITLQLEKVQSEIYMIDSLAFTIYVALGTDLYPSSDFSGALASLNNKTTDLSEQITQIVDILCTYLRGRDDN